MPSDIVKTLAKKANKSEKEVEKKWDQAKDIASEELGKKEKDFTDKDWSYVTGILKKMLKIKESKVMKDKKLKSFFESKRDAKSYLEMYMDYPGYEDEYMEMDYDDVPMDNMYMDEDEADYSDTYYDEYGNPVSVEFEVEPTDEMVSGSLSAPSGPIEGPISPPNEDDYVIEDGYVHMYKGKRKR